MKRINPRKTGNYKLSEIFQAIRRPENYAGKHDR